MRGARQRPQTATRPQPLPLQGAVGIDRWIGFGVIADNLDVLDMRPIYHQTDSRVQAHIYVAALALLIHRAIEKKLEAARIDLSAAEAFTALKSVRVVDIDLGDGATKRSVTAGTNRAAMVLRALGIEKIDPPTPPREGETKPHGWPSENQWLIWH
jgi:hypothetical protein